METVHLAGETDPHVAADAARALPYPFRTIAGGHDVSRSPEAIGQVVETVAQLGCVARACDPARRLLSFRRRPESVADALSLERRAPPLARLDLEVTGRCDRACPRCARTLYRIGTPPRDLDADRFRVLLEGFPFATEVILVGLGEPLLHPALVRIVSVAAGHGLRTRMVTNGNLATPDRLAALRDAGLAEVTFSLDTLDPAQYRQLRGGALLDPALSNLKRVPPGLERTMFAAVSSENLAALPALIDLAADLGMRGFGVSDVNFPENQPRSLHASGTSERLADVIRHATRRGVLLVGPHFHSLGLHLRALPFIAVRLPSDLSGRSERHRLCLAPWRIAVINADESLSPCNCAPTMRVTGGRPSDLWNGARMQEWRRSVLAGENPLCRICPRH